MHIPRLPKYLIPITVGLLAAYLLVGWLETQTAFSIHFGSVIDSFWRSTAQQRFKRSREQRIELRKELLALFRQTPGHPELNDTDESEITTARHYGKIPEILVDRGHGAIFPQPIQAPRQYSWKIAAARCAMTLREIAELKQFVENWKKQASPHPSSIAHINEKWSTITQEALLASQEMRYLEFWNPALLKEFRRMQTSKIQPLSEQFTKALKQKDWKAIHQLQESFRPNRVLTPSFLPTQLTPNSRIILPLATDISDRRFLAEFEGALSTHWNQSPWARALKITFVIAWKPLPMDPDFAAGRRSFSEHLGSFPKESTIMTTGGLTTHVSGRAFVLSPDPINARTLAHEIGHLLGFGDCYFRTLIPSGFNGFTIHEWSNPFFPDELMCDNHVGVARVLRW